MALQVLAAIRSRWVVVLAVLSFGYAAGITYFNLQHIRSMPGEQRIALESLDDLANSVKVFETDVAPVNDQSDSDRALQRRDVRVLYGDAAFPLSKGVWVNAELPWNDPGRYLHRFRVGSLSYANQENSLGEPLRRLFLIEVHQNFSEHGDQPRANLWLFPSPDTAQAAYDNPDAVEFVHNVDLKEAMADPVFRGAFADNHARLVRAFPALAALLTGCAALGSIVLVLWRKQPWAVFATTVTFVLPIVSAAPFLTAFGWLPLVAAVVLGYVVTTSIVCAVEQRALPVLKEKLKSGWPRYMAEAALIPVTALFVGTVLVVSFASVSVIEWQGLGSGSPGEIFMESLIRPAIGLLMGGAGSSLILAVFYLFWGVRSRSRSASSLIT